MKLICKCIGGSRMYGLASSDSDYDYRGVFVNTQISQIIGLQRFDHLNLKIELNDTCYYELRHFLLSLHRSNSQMVELLYNDEWQQIEPAFKQIQTNREKLIDSERLYTSLCGYMCGELRLANGERQGDIGKKRNDAIKKYGFSPKNWVNLIRLAYSGAYFFDTGVYPTYFISFCPDIGLKLKDLKNNPEKYNLKTLQQEYIIAKQILDESYAASEIRLKFDSDYANSILLKIYLPILEDCSIIRKL